MKLNDTVWGGLLLALSLAILWNIRTFPKIPGQSIGPAAFPGLLAVLLAGCAVLLIVRGVRAGAAKIELGEWVRSPRHVGNFLLALAAPAFYIATVTPLGFIVASTIILLALFWKLGVRPWVAVLVAVVTAFVIHAVFYKILRVSLPWGVLPILY